MQSNDVSARSARHRWKFFRAGGFDQVRLTSGADLAALEELDQKLWVALSCPTHGLEFDGKTLALIDSDNDGRIRIREVLSATRWACEMLKDPNQLLSGADSLPLAAINDLHPQGLQLLESARQILVNLGKPQADAISSDDVMDTNRIFAQTVFNGDGIVPADSASDQSTRQAIVDILACVGAQTDRSGKPGIDQAHLDKFFADAEAYSNWYSLAETDTASILPFGPQTHDAWQALAAIRVKIDDFFARCRLAAFDPRALGAVNRQESEYLAIAAQDMTITAAEIADFPLARVGACVPMPMEEGINPAWAQPMIAFKTHIVERLLGAVAAITENDWTNIKKRMVPFETWMGAKAGAAVEPLGIARVRELLASNAKDAIATLIAKDKALEAQVNAIAAVERLIRYNRDLYRLLNNFVAFRDFYGRKDKAIFQAGTLYLDQRSCDLCVRVDDPAKHVVMAHLSRIYLVYCDVARKSTGEKMTIAAAFTAGDSDNLMVGRNGIFYDRKDQDWDATVTKIIENPISLHQAFWAPYKKVIRWMSEQLAKRAAATETEAANKVTTATSAAAAKPADVAKPRIDVGVVAALGVAVGGITAAMGMLLQAFFGLGLWMPVGLVAFLLLISGPSILIAWLKLRHRNLGPLLDANGWAVNAKAKINIPFGRSLTGSAKLPAGARRELRDPYAPSNLVRNLVLAFSVVLLFAWFSWYYGIIEHVVPGKLPQSEWVKEHIAPATVKPSNNPATQAVK